ncbi:MAG: nucleoside triphosphate pyrophosphohydrolase [Candidatus Gastranaerophilales bacterium]|nr:nucleoside triphosphate pyrophosphohydrolase [Candidatus Gastranaerophilales bacterium]
MEYKNLKDLIKIIEVLRSKNGCVWDRAQTHESLTPNMLEEAYEAVEAIKEHNPEHLREELGDVLLQVLLHSQIAKESNEFDIEDVAKELKDKLIHRHPHVFGNRHALTPQDVVDNWEKLKQEEKTERKSRMDGIPLTLPALMACQKISKRAVKSGFEWDKVETLLDCIKSEYDEFKSAVESRNTDAMEDEMGDIFFATVNLARWYKIDAEEALLRANRKFMKRFGKMEELAIKPLEEYSFDEYDKLWKQAKKELRKT